MAHLKYINIEDAVQIHKMTIENSGGGATGHLDLGALESVLQHIQNDDYYPTFVDKITHLFFGACQFHCFQDGNKRIAITLSAQFLIINGYMKVAGMFFREMENISYHVAGGKIKEDLLKKIIESILKGEYGQDEELKLEIFNAIL